MVTAAQNVFRGTRVCVWAAQNTQNIGIAHRARQRVPGAYGVAQISPWWLLGPPVASPPILLPLYFVLSGGIVSCPGLLTIPLLKTKKSSRIAGTFQTSKRLQIKHFS